MRLTVQYFALLRDQRGLDRETLDTEARTAAALYDDLRARHGFTLEANALKVAINDDFAPWQAPLTENDLVVFIPPVAGG